MDLLRDVLYLYLPREIAGIKGKSRVCFKLCESETFSRSMANSRCKHSNLDIYKYIFYCDKKKLHFFVVVAFFIKTKNLFFLFMSRQ